MAADKLTRDDVRALLTAGAPALDDALRAHSKLPGPRGNLELAALVADEADLATCLRLAAFNAAQAPVNTPDEFLAFCGVFGLGRHVSAGHPELLDALRSHAGDARWRTREAVAMALQRVGDGDPTLLAATAGAWAQGSRLEQRAAVAAVSEPRLLRSAAAAQVALEVLDTVTATLPGAADRRSTAFGVLRQALGYAWSVVIVATPTAGKQAFARLAAATDPDLRWVVRENLKKNRLKRLDAAWVAEMAHSTES